MKIKNPVFLQAPAAKRSGVEKAGF
jgi:hypothetical protein